MNLDLKQMVNWFLVRGILLILFAALVILFQDNVVQMIFIAIGLYIIIIAIKFLADLFSKKVTRLDRWALVEIVLLVALGVVMIFYYKDLMTILGTLIGAFAFVAGIFQIVFALTSIGRLRLWLFITGLLGIALGLLLFNAPAWGFITLISIFIGVYLFILGIVFFALSFYFRSLQKTIDKNSIIER